MSTQTDPKVLAESTRAFVVAPAGFGKTELIARAVNLSPGRSLVLTHTHSGVNAMRARLIKLGIPSGKYDVATIAGFALKYASAYPVLSKLSVQLPTGDDWQHVYAAGVDLLKRRVARDVLTRSFSGVYVDEYQDCNMLQHSIVLAIAEVLPCRLLGDPLQAVFDFKKQPTINWQSDVIPQFSRLPDLCTPYRWMDSNTKLGQWLADVRPSLIAGSDVHLGDPALHWMTDSHQNQLAACHKAAHANGSVVTIKKIAPQAHALASKLQGRYSSMEELECNTLMEFAIALDAATSGFEKAALLVGFTGKCFTKIASELAAAVSKYEAGTLPSVSKISKNREMIEALNGVAMQPDVVKLLEAARLIETHPQAIHYRKELWQEMKAAFRLFLGGGYESLHKAAWSVREKARHYGRKPELRIVSRVLLVKGLEFDRAVVLDTKQLDAREFYVAVSRSKDELTVVSASPVVRFPAVTNILPPYE